MAPGTLDCTDTIVAVSTPPGRSAAALLRVSGLRAIEAVCSLARSGAEAIAGARGASGAAAALTVGGTAVGVWVQVYRAPRSYTREDLVEVFVPGSPPLVRQMVAEFLRVGPGLRRAGPGEFTLRAYLNGRIDLAQAEAVAALIASSGQEEARAARRALDGEFGSRLRCLASAVLELLALLEAGLDFPEEEFDDLSEDAVRERLRGILGSLRGLRQSSTLRVPEADRLRVVLAGLPNAGKSSLLNALAGRPVAITAEVPGTTRDPVRASTLYAGRQVEWIDLAGFGAVVPGAEGSSPPQEGGRVIAEIVRRLSRLELARADRVLWVADAARPLEEALRGFEALDAPWKLLVFQKADLLAPRACRRLEELSVKPTVVSARERTGLDGLVARTASPAGRAACPAARSLGDGSPGFLVSTFQEAALSVAEEALQRAGEALGTLGRECAAADLREALAALQELTGGGGREEVLEWIFSRFCIGK